MPTLRQRREDILPLARSFIRRFSAGLNKPVDGLGADAETLLVRHDWPGNVRELENMIERAVLLTEGQTITAADLRMAGRVTAGGAAAADIVRIPPSGVPLESIERQALLEALKMSNWVPRAAADLLSISLRVMHYKIKALGIEYRSTAKN
jgi:DNA-binding NtrC family response regulator